MRLFLLFLIYTLFSIDCHTKDYYVSIKGNDNNNGSIKYPFATIEKALSEIKKFDTPSNIYLRKGTYHINKTIELQNFKDIVISAFSNENVCISGGVKINSNYIKKTTNNRIISINGKAINHYINYIDCKEAQIKLTNITPKGFAQADGPSWNELCSNEQIFHLARWPNNDMIQLNKVIKSGNILSQGIRTNENPIIGYTVNRPKNWVSVTNAWIGGYFGEGWADDLLPILRVDKIHQTITVASSSYYGFIEGKYYNRWYVCNLLEELDLPNEYVIDHKLDRIYFIPTEKTKNNLQISIMNTPIFSIKSCKNISIKNITIECTRGTGIEIDSCQQITINKCVIRNIGHIGIKISNNNSTNNKIKKSSIYNIGTIGIELNSGDIKLLTPGNSSIEECKIYNFSRLRRTVSPAISLNGVGNRISHTEIYDSPSMAVYIHGNNHTIEYSDIHHVCKEAHDNGAIYYGRNPTERGHIIRYSYFHDIQSPYTARAMYHDDGACGMKIYGCIFNNISSAPVQIGGGQDIEYTNNIFMNLTSAITIDARLKTWANKWLQPGGEYDKKFRAVKYDQLPYSEAYPELLNYWIDDPSTPKRNIISNNIFYNVKNAVERNMEYLVWKNNWVTQENPGFKNIQNPLEGIEYQLIRNHIHDFFTIPLNSIGCHY